MVSIAVEGFPTSLAQASWPVPVTHAIASRLLCTAAAALNWHSTKLGDLRGRRATQVFSWAVLRSPATGLTFSWLNGH